MQESDCPDLKLIARGKVRDLYEIDGGKYILFVATDRIRYVQNGNGSRHSLHVNAFSAFDVIMKNGIQDKGKLLTKISVFWFHFLQKTASIPNHLITVKFDEMPLSVQKYKSQLEGRSMLVKKLRILPVEAIVRGYITGKIGRRNSSQLTRAKQKRQRYG